MVLLNAVALNDIVFIAVGFGLGPGGCGGGGVLLLQEIQNNNKK